MTCVGCGKRETRSVSGRCPECQREVREALYARVQHARREREERRKLERRPAARFFTPPTQ